MRLLRNFFSKYRADIFYLFCLNVLAWYVWRRLPELVIRSDGFLYLLDRTQKWFWNLPYFYTGFETSAVLFGNLFVRIFGTNISWYFWTELVFMMIINSLFYVMLQVIVKYRFVAFATALMFATNYFGNWDMYTDHCYCFFLERIINTPLIILGFLFLHCYLERKKSAYLWVSIALYFLGIGLAHFSVFITPLFLFYPIFWSYKKTLVGFSYALISGFFVLIQRVMYPQIGPTWTFFQFILDPSTYQYVEQIVRQLTYWSQYPDIIRNGAWSFRGVMNVPQAIALTPYVLIFYSIITVLVFMKLPKFRALLFTTIAATTAMFLLNAYFHQYDVLHQPGANRYLYFPTYTLVMFWGLCIYMLYRSRRLFTRLLAVLLIIGYYGVNLQLVSDNFSQIIRVNKSTKALFSHVIQTRSKLAPQTLVVATYPEFWVQEAEFFTQTLGNGVVEYASESLNSADWRTKVPNVQQVIRISYNKRCGCVVETKIK